MDHQRVMELMAKYKAGLLEDLLPFWLNYGIDRDYGGFITSLNRDGSIVDTDKGVWQQGRFTWLLGELYNNFEANDEWIALAQHGADFLERYCTDTTDGRMWFHVTREGKPIRKRRYAYSESFAAIAYGELAQALESDRYAEKAEKAFHSFIDHSFGLGCGQPKFTGVRPTHSIGFPMIAINTAQELRGSIGLADADIWIDRCIESIARLHMNEDLECVMETVGLNGEVVDHFDGRTLCPGHAIEAAWFIMKEGKHRSNSQLIEMGCRMLDWMWKRGWDPEFGGILYFTDLYGLPVQEYWHDMKFWWPHNETITATLMAYALTGERRYADWHRLVHDWSFLHFPDEEHGEWFGYLHRDGTLSSALKGSLWKGPFHLPRMQLEAIRILGWLRQCS